MKEEAWNGNNRGKWSLWASIGLVVVLIIILFLYLALKGPNYDEQYSTKNLVNPTEGLSLEQAVEKFDESFVYYLLFSIKAYNLHNPPLSGNSPKMEIFVGNEQYNSIINKGKIEIGRGDLEKEDILKELVLLRGSSKRKTTDAQLHGAREKAFEILEKKFR